MPSTVPPPNFSPFPYPCSSWDGNQGKRKSQSKGAIASGGLVCLTEGAFPAAFLTTCSFTSEASLGHPCPCVLPCHSHLFTAASCQSQSREDVGSLTLSPPLVLDRARDQDWRKTQAPVPQYTFPSASCMSLGSPPCLHLHKHRSAKSWAGETVSETGTIALLGQTYRMIAMRAESHFR